MTTSAARPLQNRVTPFGEIVRTPARGAWMGNRGGCLHDDNKALLRRRWVSRRCICCVLAFMGRHREVMTPRRYTELFFLDEATALAAGHRPCAECRRRDFNCFVAAWRAAHGAPTESRISASGIDLALHAERLGPGGMKVTYEAPIAALPDGVMVARASDAHAAWLLWQGALHLWTPEGYARQESVVDERVRVLTPRSPRSPRAIPSSSMPRRAS